MRHSNRIFRCLCVLWLGMAACAAAQVEGLHLKLKLEYPSTIQYEPVVAFLTIANNTAKPFVVSESGRQSAAVLEFAIRRNNNEAAPRLNERLVADKIYIPSDQKEDAMIELSDFYDMREPGRYMVSAMVTWDGKTYWSERQMLDVVSGIELASVSKSLPDYQDRIRKYTLRYWNRQGREYLFLVVEEEETKLNYGVFQLGPVVRLSFKPFVEVDREGNVRVVQQTGNDCYIHSFFKSDRNGIRFLDHAYRRENGDPYTGAPPDVKSAELPLKPKK